MVGKEGLSFMYDNYVSLYVLLWSSYDGCNFVML